MHIFLLLMGISFTILYGMYPFHILYHQFQQSLLPQRNLSLSCDICSPGVYNTPSQLPWRTWSTNHINIPLYTTHDLELTSQYNIESVVILLHGNLRNCNDYFCAGVQSLPPMDSSKYLIITPEFLILGDNCYENGVLKTITENDSCNVPYFHSEGWKDGTLNANKLNEDTHIHSYDILNILLDRVGDTNYFPNVKSITLFGFSAGAQMLQRYVMMPKFYLLNTYAHIKYIISDPSTFLYFDNKRPYSMNQFDVPNASWLRQEWNIDAHTNQPWITSWDETCSKYNDWRYGFNDLIGYSKIYFEKNSIENAITAYAHRDITYVIGTKDSCNCNLQANDPNCEDITGRCNDNDLATYCQGNLIIFVRLVIALLIY